MGHTTTHTEDTVHTFSTSPVDSPANITTTPSTRNTSLEDNTLGKKFRGVSTSSGRVCDGGFGLLGTCVDSLQGPSVSPHSAILCKDKWANSSNDEN